MNVLGLVHISFEWCCEDVDGSCVIRSPPSIYGACLKNGTALCSAKPHNPVRMGNVDGCYLKLESLMADCRLETAGVGFGKSTSRRAALYGTLGPQSAPPLRAAELFTRFGRVRLARCAYVGNVKCTPA